MGRSGKLLRHLLSRAGLDKYKIGFTNTVRCGTRKSGPKDIKYCRPFLLADIHATQPKLIVPVGAIALRGMINRADITKYHGHLIYRDGFALLPTFHPAFALRDPAQQPEILKDLMQAKEYLDGLNSGQSRIEILRQRYEVPRTEEDLEDALQRIEDPSHPYLAWDTEFYPLEWLGTETICYAMIFAYKAKHAIVILVDHPESPFLNHPTLKARLANILRTRPLVPHHAEPDAMVAEKCFGVSVDELIIPFDTLPGAIALFGPEAGNSLKALSYTADADTGGYHLELEKYRDSNKIDDYGKIPWEILCRPYGGGDGDTTFQLSAPYMQRIRAQGSSVFYYRCLLPGYLLDIEMRKNGLLIDQEELDWRVKWYTEEKENCYKQAREFPLVARFAEQHEKTKKGAKFSLKSAQQMSRIVFDLYEIAPSSVKTKSGAPSLDKNAVQEMLLREPQESEGAKFLNLLDYSNKVATTLSMGIGPLVKNIWPDGRLHPRFGLRAESGRRRTRDPNVQNITEGKRAIWAGDPDKNPWNLRMLIKAREGHKFIYPDLSQVEFRLAACHSKDKNMIAGCRPKPFDAHTMVAKEFGIDRNTAKIFNFALIFDASAERLQAEIFEKTGQIWPLAECEKIRLGIRAKYADLFLLKAAYTDFMKKHGYVITPIFGHKRLLPKAMEGDERAIREGWNHLMQSMSHGLLDLIMQEVYKDIRENNRPWYLENDKHDAFLMEAPDAEVPEAAALCSQIMKEVPAKVLGKWMIVPIEGEVAVGTHFGNLKEYQV